MELFSVFIMLMMMLVPISATDILLGSFLVAGSNSTTTTSWKSNSGEFAFGFQQVSAQGYLLAIVFDKITPNKTIVWSANRNNIADRGSKVQLSADGSQFVLVNSKDQIIWSANLSGSGVAYAAMLDNGNFVLARDNSSSAYLWQSFDEPTDTLLPGQVLNQGSSLLARFSKTNHSIGRFRFILQGDGNLVLYTINYPLANSVYGAYWSTQTFNRSGEHIQLIFNQSGKIYLKSSNGTVLKKISPNGMSTSQFHQRLTLDYDGGLRHYSHPKSSSVNSTKSWSVKIAEPLNICLRVGGTKGAGACGFNSLCFQGTDDRPACHCPERFSIVDPTDRMSGCKPDFIRPGCDFKNSSNFELQEVADVDWPGSDYDYFESVDEDWCKKACIADCFCDAAVYRNEACWKMGMPLRNGRFSDLGGKSFLKVPRRN